MWGFKYVRVLNILGLSIWQGSGFPGLRQGLPIFVNITVFCICVGTQLCKGSEYSRIPNKSGFCICEHYTRS